MSQLVKWFEELDNSDVGAVGGKNASLGEMIQNLKSQGVRVPGGFATTAQAYWQHLEQAGIKNRIEQLIEEYQKNQKSLSQTGKSIRKLFLEREVFNELDEQLSQFYDELCQEYNTDEISVAVRSSATAEDLPEASFAGQLESYLNISGKKALREACKKCMASLFTDRAINYREERGFDHLKVALSVGIQKMVRSDKAGAGVMFSIHTETGFPEVAIINAAWGLGEAVVQGQVDPDEYLVFKPFLEDKQKEPIVQKSLGKKEAQIVYAHGGNQTTKTVKTSSQKQQQFVLENKEVLQLARWAQLIEKHYDKPMDMEWGKDGQSGELYILQARPETVQSQKEASTLQSYSLNEKGKVLTEGLAIGEAIANGKICVIESSEQKDEFEEGSILVTTMTDPDWGPVMKKAAAIVTDHGGRTSHAAIVSRELGIPAVVGCGNATKVLKSGGEATISCAEGATGYIYDGCLEYQTKDINLEDVPSIQTQIMMNLASPASAFRWWKLPVHGIGLARMEFIINNIIKIHPMALLRYSELQSQKAKKEIDKITQAYTDKSEFFVDQLAQGLGQIAASQYPNEVIVRMSDFKTNEYANLIGGDEFEPNEANPMLGFRGASRYYSDLYREGFQLECRAIYKLRETLGFGNVKIMIPFCRTLEEAEKVLDILEDNGLERGKNGLEVYVMAELPANILLAQQFAKLFDGFSIGSNDLTQLVLGVDRDSDLLKELFDERNEAVKEMIRLLIQAAKETKTKVGICGQGPSDYPDFAAFLVEEGIDSISLNPDTVIDTIHKISEVEKELEH